MSGHQLLIGIDDPRRASSLRRWLLNDIGLRGRIEVRVDAARSNEASGDDNGDNAERLADPTAIVAVALSTLMALPAFITSVRTWFDGQPPATPAIVLRNGETTVQISGETDPAVIATLAATLAATPKAGERLATPLQDPGQPLET